jgi:predicted MFS family arabinose efflux permease
LALLLAVREQTSSLASAGTAVAALGAGFAVAAPVHGRVLDRLGARRVLPLVTTVHAGALVLIAGSCVPVAALALVAGATTPPLSALMRAAWLDRVSDEDQRAFVLGVEAVAVEASFVLGPAAVSLLLLVAKPGTALVVLAAVTATGTLGFAAAAGDTTPPVPSGAGALGPLRSPGLRTLLAATAAFGAADGVAQIAVVGATGERLAGLLLTIAGAGSVGGGLLYVRRRHRDSVVDFSSAHLAMAAALVLAAAASPSDPWLAVVLLGHGVVGSPVPIANSRLLAHVTAQRQATEAGTWLVVAVVVGAAVGSGVGGWIVEQAGVPPALLVAAAAMASAGGIASARRATLR